MVFEKRKIQFETLGEYLLEVRLGLNLSVDDVLKATGIKTNFLENLEKGKYQQLPPDVYVLGFIRQLAELYALDFKVLMLQYKKEKNIYYQLEKNLKAKYDWRKKFLEKFILTPKSLSLFAGLFFFFASLIYISWQVFSINKAPSLEIYLPTDKQTVKESFVKVSGKTDPGMSVLVNGQNLFVMLDGKFETQVGISNGPQEINITAKNRFEKLTSKTVSVLGEAVSKSQAELEIKMQVEFLGKVEFSYMADDQSVKEEVLNSSDKKEILAKKRITISSSDGGLTKIFINGKSTGLLGRSGEKIVGMVFTSESVK